MILLLTLIFMIWVVGIWHFWRRQSKSIPYVTVKWTDRLLAIFWFPFGLIILLWLLLNMITGRR